MQAATFALVGIDGVDKPALDELNAALNKFTEVKGLIGEDALQPQIIRMWDSISKFWSQHKQDSEAGKLVPPWQVCRSVLLLRLVASWPCGLV